MCEAPGCGDGKSPGGRRGRNFSGAFPKTPDRLAGMALIRFYQLTLSSVIGSSCRHTPTCSEYGYEAIARHGLWSGGWLTLFRVARCGPGGTWGFDPVPPCLGGEYAWWAPWRFWRIGDKRGGLKAGSPAPAFDPRQKVIDYHAAINALDFDRIESFFAEHAVYISGGTGNTIGREAIMSEFREYFEIFPDQVAWDDVVEPAGACAARSAWNLKATNARSGAIVERRGLETVEFDKHGSIIRIVVEDR